MIKVIPDLSKSEINDKYIKSKKINGFSNGEISFEDGTINEEDNIELSNDKEISSIKSIRNISLIGNDKNVLNNIEIEENGLLDLNETNNENIIEGIIKGLTINYNSETELVYNETDENISNKIKKIISNIKLSNLNESRYVNEKDNYKVEIPKIKNYKDLRKLVVAFKPIQFSSTLFKTNKLGLKMALNAQVSFFPGNGTSIIKMILIMNEKKINLIDKKITTNFRNIADEINNLIDKIGAGIYDINYEFENYLESIENEIKGNISLLEDNLNKTYNISEIYDDDVKEISEKLIKNIYEERYEYLIENYKNNNDELNEIKNRTNFTNIITESNSNFQIFYNESLDKINKVYENIKKFFKKIYEKGFEDESNLELEIDTYYGISDELKIINQSYLEFISKLKDSIENEIYEFNNRINKEFKNIIESNLTEIEKIVEEMKYNERV